MAVKWHPDKHSSKSEAERAQAASDTKTFLEGIEGKGKVNMWMDTLDDTLEALYEARPWRWYVINATDDTVIACTGLAPFNMAGKLDVIKKATAGAPGGVTITKTA